jgi:nickel superoxide dismutase
MRVIGLPCKLITQTSVLIQLYKEDVMNKKLFSMLLGFGFIFFIVGNAAAHCEIPCGIYDDEARIAMLLENTATIEKSMIQITELEKAEPLNSNQLIRWVMNKERHADELQEIVTHYFMTQRISLDAKEYDKKIGVLHQMLIYSMKCKQTTDLGYVEKLRMLIKEFHDLYFQKE